MKNRSMSQLNNLLRQKKKKVKIVIQFRTFVIESHISEIPHVHILDRAKCFSKIPEDDRHAEIFKNFYDFTTKNEQGAYILGFD